MLDKASVECFSKFYYINTITIGIHIIKPNKEEREVDPRDAIAENGNIPSFYSEFVTGSNNYRKLAIPGIEVGDIIDYFFLNENILTSSEGYAAAIPIIFELGDEYPILNQTIEFHVEKRFYVNFISLNGAPELESTTRDKEYVYTLKDKMRDKIANEYWNFKYRNIPTIKFQVIYSNLPEEKTPYLFGEVGKPKTKSDPLEVVQKINNMTDVDNEKNFANRKAVDFFYSCINGYVKKKRVPKTDKANLLKEAYYYFRDITLVKLETSPNFSFPSNSIDSRGGLYSLSDNMFLEVLAQFCKEYEIPYKFICGVPRRIGVLDDLILVNEVTVGMKAELDKPVYLFPFDKFSHFGQTFSGDEGIDVYEFKPNHSIKKLIYKRYSLPTTNSTENVHLEISNIKIDKDFENVELSREFKLKGISRYDYYNTALFYEDWGLPELSKYGRSSENGETTRNKARLAEIERKNKELAAQLNERRFENLKKDLKEQKLDVKSVDGFELISDGRFDENPEFNFKIKATLQNLVKKAGNNYILDIGKVFGSQIELDAEDKIRHYNIYQSYMRSIADEITFEIPEGYKLDDIKSLNMNVDNESASFITTAKTERNILKISISKTYKTLFDKKENWDNYVKVLDKAYEFYQKKIVLKKA